MLRATLTSATAFAIGCSTLKTYYSEYSVPPTGISAAQNRNSNSLPPVEHSPKATEKSNPSAVEPASASDHERSQAAAEAEAASVAALKASQEAARAAGVASRAAARAAGTASPSAQPTPPPPMLSSTDIPDRGPERQHAADMIDDLNRAMRTIDRQKLDADGQNRAALGETFLQSAQKAYAEGSYAEATSLAGKASTMIAPLIPSPARISP